MYRPTIVVSLVMSACVLLFTGCATPWKPVSPPLNKPVANVESYWQGEGLSGPSSIVVKLGEQRAYFYRGRLLAGVAKISSGRRLL
jgi:hypothetical protein